MPALLAGCEPLEAALQLESETNETVLEHQIRKDVPFIKK